MELHKFGNNLKARKKHNNAVQYNLFKCETTAANKWFPNKLIKSTLKNSNQVVKKY